MNQPRRIASGWVLLVVIGTIAFSAPMFLHPEGIASGDAFRDNDWLNCRSFDLLATRALREDGQFPLRSHLVGGGFPTIIHPSDSSWAPTLPAVLLLGDVLGVKVNLTLLLVVGALGVYGLARRWARLARFPAAFAALLFAFSGWMPSMMLVGFYHQAFYLPIPAVLWLLLTSPGRPHRLLLAGFLLFVVLQQGGHALPASLHFLGFALWFRCAAGRAAPLGRARAAGWTVAVLAVPALITAPLAFAAVGFPSWIVIAGPMAALASLAWRPMWAQARSFAPWGGRLLIAVGIAAILGAPRVLGLAQLASEGEYDGGLELMGLYSGGESPKSFWIERFYEGPRALLEGVLGRVPAVADYETDAHGRPGSNLDPEYGFLGLTVPGFALAIVGGGIALWRRRAGGLVVSGTLYTAVCLGWFLPPDLHFLYARGLPWLDRMSQPVKYFNFFVLLAAVMLAGMGVQALLRRLPRGRVRGIGALAAGLVLAAPLAQNGPILAERFAEARPAPRPVHDFHQVAMIEDAAWIHHPDRDEKRRAAHTTLRDLRRPEAAQEYHNIRRGVGTVDWYGTVIAAEAAAPREFITPDGESLRNPHYHGEAWVDSGQAEIRSVHIRPNTVDLDVHVTRPAKIVINQNSLPGFRTNSGRVSAHRGLLAVNLEPGHHRARLTYAPRPVLASLCVSAVAFLVWLTGLTVSILRIRGRRSPV